MSKGGSSETTVSEPWAGAQPYIKKGYEEASGIYDKFTPQFYGGQTQASFSPDQLTAQAGVRDWATQGAPNVMNPALGAYQYGAGSQVLQGGPCSQQRASKGGDCVAVRRKRAGESGICRWGSDQAASGRKMECKEKSGVPQRGM